jgi:hypothetical protein
VLILDQPVTTSAGRLRLVAYPDTSGEAQWWRGDTPVVAPAPQQGNTPSDSSPSGGTSPNAKKEKPKSGNVQVRGYYRKNGTWVAPHVRSAPSRGGRR